MGSNPALGICLLLTLYRLSSAGSMGILTMAAGVTDHVWKLPELVGLLEGAEQAVPMKRGPYKKRVT